MDDPPPGPRPFTIEAGPRLHAGIGSTARLVEEVDGAGGRDVLLVTDAGVRATGIPDRIIEILRPLRRSTVIVDDIPANPTVDAVERATARARTLDDPVLIAVGGGSVLDAAKAISLTVPTGLDSRTLAGAVEVDPIVDAADRITATPPRPLIAVPTTAGTGAETNGFAVLTDPLHHRKVYVGDHRSVPIAAILDPELTVGMPPAVTASTGMDALTHALESLASRNSDPISATQALRAVELVFANLPVARDVPHDLEARSAMLLAAHLAGRALTTTGLGVAHAIGHALSNRHGLAHGVALATVLPTVVEHNAPAADEAFTAAHEAARAGTRTREVTTGMRPEPAPGERRSTAALHPLVPFVARLSTEVGTDHRLRDLGVTEDRVDILAADAIADPVIDNNPLPIDHDTAAFLIRGCH